jgi:hypothetical protein
MIGNFFRPGALYTQEVVQTFDHDWPSLAEGVVWPHGLYDLKRNEGFVTLGTSHDTSAFACDSLRWWWQEHGRHDYPTATSLLLLCDGGGSNRATTYLFKAELEKFAQETGLEVRVAHYPPYTSKYNPIEHRLFPHLTRACSGVILTSVELVKELMAKATTKTGLRVAVHIIDQIYETGRRVAADVKERIRLIFDEALPRWNYRLLPGGTALGRVI